MDIIFASSLSALLSCSGPAEGSGAAVAALCALPQPMQSNMIMMIRIKESVGFMPCLLPA